MALIGDRIYEYFSKGFRGQPSCVLARSMPCSSCIFLHASVSEVYIIDFGLAKKYRNPETLVHGRGARCTNARVVLASASS